MKEAVAKGLTMQKVHQVLLYGNLKTGLGFKGL